jgi:CRP/FNR family transcriptional regulator
LRQLPLFKGLETTTLSQLAQGATLKAYAAGEVIFLEGETSAGLYYLASGWLKIVKSSPEGREQVLRIIGPTETFNEVGAFANRPNPATAIALETVSIWLLQRDMLMRIVREQSALAQRIIENMADNMIHLVNLVADISLRPVAGRLARLLLDEANEGNVLLRPLWQTQTELAARLGTVPDVLQRALRTLESEGVIQVQRREIRILDLAGLAKWAA